MVIEERAALGSLFLRLRRKIELRDVEVFEIDRDPQFSLQHFGAGGADRQMHAPPRAEQDFQQALRVSGPAGACDPRRRRRPWTLSLSRPLKPTDSCLWAFFAPGFVPTYSVAIPNVRGVHVTRSSPHAFHHTRESLPAGKFRDRIGQIIVRRLVVPRDELSDPRRTWRKYQR